MGSIHKKYVESLEIDYMWYDPHKSLDDQKRLVTLENLQDRNFTHFILATPEDTHYSLYKKIRDEVGRYPKILVEKPVILDMNNSDIFEDDKMFPGLVERFNPVVKKLKDVLDVKNIINIDFVRCSTLFSANKRVDSYTDVGIHDVDLLFFLLNEKKVVDYRIDKVSNTFTLVTRHTDDVLCRFLWSNETFSKERKIVVRQKNCTYEADLIDQTLKKYTSHVDLSNKGVVCENFYIEKMSPIRAQLENFIDRNGTNVNSKSSHEFYLKVKSVLFDEVKL